MAKYIYEWKATEHGNRLFRRPGSGSPVRAPKAAAAAAAPEPEPEAEPAGYTAWLKDDLIASAEERGLDISGTKADIIERLEADDEQA